MKKIYWMLTLLLSANIVLGAKKMKIISPSFKNNEILASTFVYTDCGGNNTSPALSWDNAPQNTKSFVLICDDPDAPSPANPAKNPWVHWIVYNIPGTVNSLQEAQNVSAIHAQEGINSWGHTRYDGPCPPKGSGVHRYIFMLYALDIDTIALAKDPSKQTIQAAMKNHILATCSIIGTYEIK